MASTSGSSGCSVPTPMAPGSAAAVSATQWLSSRAMPGLCAYEKKQKRSTPRSAGVADGDPARQQVLEPCLLGRHQQQRGDRRMVVAVRVDELAMPPYRQADLHTERLRVAMDRLAVQLVEHPELDGVGGLVHRLD